METHSKGIGYILWIFGFMGAHRFYYGRPVSGTIYFCTLGLLFIGWIVDLFLIPGRRAQVLSWQMDSGHHLFPHWRPLPGRDRLRLLDPQPPDQRGQCRPCGRLMPKSFAHHQQCPVSKLPLSLGHYLICSRKTGLRA